MRTGILAHALLPLTLVACGGSAVTYEAPDAAGDAQPRRSTEPDAATAEAGADSAPDAGADQAAPTSPDSASPATTPIALADAWVAGFYGAGYQGTNTYSNTSSPGFPDGYYTQWRGDPGVSLFSNVSDCSSFSDILLMRSYGWLPPTTNPRPVASDYYWAVRGGTGFTEITTIADIQVGDALVLLYPPGGMYTGHMAWIDALPQAFSGAPAEPGLTGYVVTVIDSNNGFHDGASGPSTADDDRYLGPLADGSQCTADTQCITLYGPNATCNSTSLDDYSTCAVMGVGRGHMRLYADSTGTIQGHTWSPNTASVFYPRPSPLPVQGMSFAGEDVVIGRYAGH
jgi:hypothetical protein